MAFTPYSPVALVTGVGRAEGIGFEVCRQLARQPMTVLLSARTLEKAKPLAALLQREGLDVRPYALNVTSTPSVQQLLGHIRRDFGQLDILVNNAASPARQGEQVATANLSHAHSMMEATLYGSWQLCQALLPLLRKSACGRIVNVSSGAGSHDDGAFGLHSDNQLGISYAIAKAALNALTSRLAHEESTDTLRINAVCPGFTASFAGGAELGARPVADGAASIVWAALLDNDGPTGGFFRDGQRLPW